MTPISRKLAEIIWCYCLIKFILTDAIKVDFYKLLDYRGIRFKAKGIA